MSSTSAEPTGVRVLGTSRTIEDVLLSYSSTSREEGLAVAKQVCNPSIGGAAALLPLYELEKAIRVFTNHNSAYTDVEEQDIAILLEEVLNNSIISILIFANHSPKIGEFELCCLSRSMQYNLSIEALTLSGLNVSDEAISLLCESLIHSRVSFIDFTLTPLQDEAGLSIAALAHLNPYLRTVVATATLFSEEILDEIDAACQFNHSNFESNGGRTVEESSLREGELSSMKQRLVQIIRVKEKKVVLCVAHLFESCPNGEYCCYSHDLSLSSVSGGERKFKDALEAMFSDGEAGWEGSLAPLPKEGASWMSPEDREVKRRGKIDVNRFRRNREESRVVPQNAPSSKDKSMYHRKVFIVAASVALSVAAVAAMIGVASRRLRIGPP